MVYGSVCSGIEAATVAWHPLGWKPAWFAEIDKFPSAVLAHHYPEVPNLGDFTKIGPEHGPVRLLVGGTPCQSFSLAGLRGGLRDNRGNLALEYLRTAQAVDAQWLVWENVPGVLSSNGGRDFGCFLGGLEVLGYGWAYRVLDAQYFGLAQSRKRVFVVGYRGDWAPAAAALFDPGALSLNPGPPRRARGEVAYAVCDSTGTRTGSGRIHQDTYLSAPVWQWTDEENPWCNYHQCYAYECPCPSIEEWPIDPYSEGMARRLSPEEYEVLQGFPVGYTNIESAADGPRYKALGNSMAVPVMRWIGERIQLVDTILANRAHVLQ